jgi:hypothetical protein
MKFRYDKNYTFFFFNIGDIAFFNFYQSYRVSGIYGKKLAQQRIRPFRVIYYILFLIYEFELLNNMSIHPIISVIHLKLISKGSDSYNRSRNNYSVSIKEDLWNNVEKK